MESREFVCPSCDNPITIKVLGSDLSGNFTLDCDQCRSHLTIDLSKSEPQLVEPPQPRRSRSAYNRLPPEMVERERRMKEAFEEAWGSPPPGAYLHDDMIPPPGRSDEPRRPMDPREGGTLPGDEPRSPDGFGGPDGTGPGRSGHPGRHEHRPEQTPFRQDGRPPIVAPGPRFPFQPFPRGPTGPPPTYLMIATGLLAAAALMGFVSIYIIFNFSEMVAEEGELEVTVVLENRNGNPIPINGTNSQMNVAITVDEDYFTFTPNDGGRYVLKNVSAGEAVITVYWPGSENWTGYKGQKREVIITEDGSLTMVSSRNIGDTFHFQLEKGSGLEDTESNPMTGMLTVCSVMILAFSLLALVGAFLAYTRKSYSGALLGGIGGILAFGSPIGPLLAIVAIYLIYRSKAEFPSNAPPSPWGPLPPMPPGSDQPPPGYNRSGYHQPGYHQPGYQGPDHQPPDPHRSGWADPPPLRQPSEPGDRWDPPLDEDSPVEAPPDGDSEGSPGEAPVEYIDDDPEGERDSDEGSRDLLDKDKDD